MTPDEVRECFENDVSPAVFSASINDGLGVKVYPLTKQNAHLWAIWDGEMDFDDPYASIKSGAVVSGIFYDVATIAVQKLFEYAGARPADTEAAGQS